MKRVILFCQAPGELNNLLSSYEEMKMLNKQIKIICLKLISLKKFLDQLNLDAEVIFFPEIPISLKNPLCYFKKRKIVAQNLKKIELTNNLVIFNSKFDMQLACYLKHFDNTNEIIYKKCRDNTALEREFIHNIGLKYKLKAYLLSYYTGFKVKYVKRESRYCEVIAINNKMFVQNYKVDEQLYSRYFIEIPEIKTDSVIFFSEPFQDSFQTKEEYDDLNIKTAHQLKKMNYNLVAKGHPRKGLHPVVKDHVDYIIPQYIPSEFINLKSFKFAVNFFSTALCSASCVIPAYSLIGMYDIRDKDTYDYWVDYINESSKNQVEIIDSFQKLPKLSKSIY